jgi:hypothetical protein
MYQKNLLTITDLDIIKHNRPDVFEILEFDGSFYDYLMKLNNSSISNLEYYEKRKEDFV